MQDLLHLCRYSPCFCQSLRHLQLSKPSGSIEMKEAVVLRVEIYEGCQFLPFERNGVFERRRERKRTTNLFDVNGFFVVRDLLLQRLPVKFALPDKTC